MNHPLWYMKPVHVFLKRLGVQELCLGSTGNQGQAALAQLGQRMLATGASTSMAVDGPKGPPYYLRKGCIHLAMETGYPLVTVRFDIPKAYRLPVNWDRKFWPPYFCEMTVHLGDPLEIDRKADPEHISQSLSEELSTPL